MPRPLTLPEMTQIRLPAGILARLDAVRRTTPRHELLRALVVREIERLERAEAKRRLLMHAADGR